MCHCSIKPIWWWWWMGDVMNRNSVWVKCHQQSAELHWSSCWSMARLLRVSKTKTNTEHWLWRVAVITFKSAYYYCLNNLLMFRFTSEGENSHQNRLIIVLHFCCKFTSIFLCAKHYQHIMRFDKVTAKIKRVTFLHHSV